MGKTNPRTVARAKRVKRIRKNVIGTAERPRLRVFKSSKHIYAQIIDDTKGHTLASMTSLHVDTSGDEEKGKCALAHKVGMLLAEKAKAVGVEAVVFDRGGYIYHGRVKALSDGARKGGLIL